MTTSPQLHPLGDVLGMEALGIDLSQPLDDGTIAWIERAFAENPVLVFRNQNLGAAELAGLGRNFGKPQPNVFVDYRHPDHPDVSWLTNVDKDGKIDWWGVERATCWHTDSTFEPEMPRLAILHALEVPSEKGGTMFANMYAAYEALPETMKDRLRDLVCLHSHAKGPNGGAFYENLKRAQEEYHDQPRPAVLRHPATGRPFLFVNPMHVHGFVGVDHDEGWALVEELARHATQERFTYYHSWKPGDVLMWDEQATLHRNAGDYRPEERRIMLRTIVFSN
jgi:alpha-ketoglutarate-dependent taurine dioxygenase